VERLVTGVEVFEQAHPATLLQVFPREPFPPGGTQLKKKARLARRRPAKFLGRRQAIRCTIRPSATWYPHPSVTAMAHCHRVVL